MAGIAKFLGVVCLVIGGVVSAFGLFFWGLMDTSELGDTTSGLVFMITGAIVTSGVVVMTVGAVAYLIGEEAEISLAARRRAWARSNPPEQPYGGSTRR